MRELHTDLPQRAFHALVYLAGLVGRFARETGIDRFAGREGRAGGRRHRQTCAALVQQVERRSIRPRYLPGSLNHPA